MYPHLNGMGALCTVYQVVYFKDLQTPNHIYLLLMYISAISIHYYIKWASIYHHEEVGYEVGRRVEQQKCG